MTDNLFDNVNSETPVLDDNRDYYAELVGPEAKFKDNQGLAKGKAYSDALIEVQNRKLDQLVAENERLLNESRAVATLKDLINQVKPAQQLASSEQPKANEVKESTFDLSLLDSKISEGIAQAERTRKETDNFNMVKNKLQERHGDKYPQVLKQTIESLGLSVEDANAMAKKSPAAFMRTLGLDQPQRTEGFQAPPQTRQNSNFAPDGGKKRTWTYYQELRRSNPKLYNDPKINIQMQRDIIDLGDSFKDGDFKAFGD